MKTNLCFIGVLLLLPLVGCGPSDEEKQKSHEADIQRQGREAAARQAENQIQSAREWAEIAQDLQDDRKLADLGETLKEREERHQKRAEERRHEELLHAIHDLKK